MVEIQFAEGVASCAAQEWNALVADGSPFLEWEWLASLEQAGCVGDGTGWRPTPLLVRAGGELVAACPLYLKGHSEGEFVFDWGWADAAENAGIDYYPKLLVGVPFTPVTGARLLVHPRETAEKWRAILAQVLRDVSEQNELSGAHVNFCTPEEGRVLEEAGFLRRVGYQYHWHNEDYASFDDYLTRFRSKRRNQIRREQRALADQGISITTQTGDALGAEEVEVMFDLYLRGIRSKYWGREYLNRDFFELLGERFRSRLVFVAAWREGRVVAGTINVRKGDTLYGRYWGAREHHRYLHFNVCYYAAVDYCIREGLKRFEPGAGGDYKQLRGFDAQPTLSGHYLRDARFAAAVANFLDNERERADEAIRWLRDQSALKPSR